MDKDLKLSNNRLLPWLSIWVKPRRTIRQIVDHNPSQSVYILSGLAGIYRFLNQAAKRTLGDSMSLWEILSLAVLFGFLIGLLYLFIEGELLRWVGNRLGGKGSAIQVRAAIAWSSVPEALLLFLFFPFDRFVRKGLFFQFRRLDNANSFSIDLGYKSTGARAVNMECLFTCQLSGRDS